MAARHYTDEGAEITPRPWTLTNVSVTRRLSYNLLFYISSRNTNSVKAVSTNFTSLREACPDERIYDLFRVAEWLRATSAQTYKFFSGLRLLLIAPLPFPDT